MPKENDKQTEQKHMKDWHDVVLPIILKQLKKSTEEAIQNIITKTDKPSRFNEAINWADLHCHSAEFYLNSEDIAGYRVYIEEASPSCPKLHERIQEQLQKKGYSDIEVITEW